MLPPLLICTKADLRGYDQLLKIPTVISNIRKNDTHRASEIAFHGINQFPTKLLLNSFALMKASFAYFSYTYWK